MANPLLTLGVIAASLTLSALAAAQSNDNILIVIADDLGVDHVRAYGEGTTTPATINIDALAARGVLCRNAWANPTCSPTRACINTGRYGFRTGVGRPGAQLDSSEITLPEILDATGSGYAHAWIGKWHLGPSRGTSHPTTAGWSHFTGLLSGQVTDYYRWPRVAAGRTNISTTYATTQIVDDAITWIRSQNGPWLCVVAFNAPHTPFHTPPANLHSQNLQGQSVNRNPFPFYQAAVEALDTEMGRLFATLGSELDRTNVIFIGDNGTPGQVSQAPFPSTHAKGTAYEGGPGVPMVIAGPAVTNPGREIGELVSVVDMVATIGDLVGIDPRSPFVHSDSVSFAPYLSNPAQTALRSHLYTESFARNSNPLTDGFATARNDRFKLIRRYPPGTGSEEFYDLTNDPFESNDLLRGTLTANEQSNRDTLAGYIDAVRDTSGRFESYGTASCVGSNGIPSISGTGTPQLGGTYDVGVTQGASSQLALVTLGAFDDVYLGVALPFDLSLLGAGPGCELWASAEILVPTVTDAAGAATASIPVPNLPLALGGTIHHAALIADPSAPNNPLQLTATAGLRAVLGQ